MSVCLCVRLCMCERERERVCVFFINAYITRHVPLHTSNTTCLVLPYDYIIYYFKFVKFLSYHYNYGLRIL